MGAHERQVRQLRKAGEHLLPALRSFSRHPPAPHSSLPSSENPWLLQLQHVPVLSSDVRRSFLRLCGWWQATLSMSDTSLLHPVLNFLVEKLISLITLSPTMSSFLRRLSSTSTGWHILMLPTHM